MSGLSPEAYTFLAVTLVVCLLVSPLLRRRIVATFHEGKVSQDSLKRRLAGRYIDWLGALVILRGLLILFLPLAIEPLLEEYWTPAPYDAILIGLALIGFLWFQLPYMLRPDFLVLPMPTSGKKYSEPRGDESVRVVAGKKKLLVFRVTSLGTHTYKDCSVWFYFPVGFKPVTEKKNYNGIDFLKQFDVQRTNRGFLFTPNKNYLTMAPLDHLLFPMWVKAPLKLAKPDDAKVSIELKSETTWGSNTHRLQIVLENSKSQQMAQVTNRTI